MSELVVLLAAAGVGLLLAVGGWLRASKREGKLEEEADAGRAQLAGTRRVLAIMSRPIARGRGLAARWRARMLHRDADDDGSPMP
jgi:hypothetical protein